MRACTNIRKLTVAESESTRRYPRAHPSAGSQMKVVQWYPRMMQPEVGVKCLLAHLGSAPRTTQTKCLMSLTIQKLK